MDKPSFTAMIGQRIKLLRSIRNMSQAQLAIALGICSTVLCRYERGKQQPSFSLIEQMAKVLNCSLLDFATPGPEGLQVSLTITPR